MNKMNESTAMIWLKFLTWLIYYQKILLIYFTNKHWILKTLNFLSKIIFIVFNYVESSIRTSKKKQKIFIR